MTTRNDVKNKKLELKGKGRGPRGGMVKDKAIRPRESPIRSNRPQKRWRGPEETLART